MPDWLTTTLSAVAGGALTMVGGWLADRRLTKRDREYRREDRRERLTDRSNDFQRETLLALQQASQQLLRNTVKTFLEDIAAYRTSGIWQQQQLPENLSDDQLRLSTENMLLATRVRDDQVRALATHLRTQTTQVAFSKNEQEAEQRIKAAVDIQASLLERTGELIRELDALL